MQKQSEAQKEAKRLYDRFYNLASKITLYENVRVPMTKEAAIICADEKEKAALAWCQDAHIANIKAFYRDVIRELKKL